MTYIILTLSIVAEVLGSTMLKLSNGFSKIPPIIGMIAGYIMAFYLVSLVMAVLPLSITYAIWSGAGTVLTALVGVLVFKEKINKQGVLGISVLIVGLVLINLV